MSCLIQKSESVAIIATFISRRCIRGKSGVQSTGILRRYTCNVYHYKQRSV